MKIVVFGLTISSSWGNGHATLWRGLCRALAAPRPPRRVLRARRALLRREPRSLRDPGRRARPLRRLGRRSGARAERDVADADVAMVTSYLPATASPRRTSCSMRRAPLGSSTISTRRSRCRASRRGETIDLYRPARPRAISTSCSATPAARRSTRCATDSARAASRRSTGMSTRRCTGRCAPRAHYRCRPLLSRHLCGRPAGGARSACSSSRPGVGREQRFLIGGAQYPQDFPWAANIFFVRHLPPAEHPAFFSSSRLTLNVTRAGHGRDGLVPVRPPVRGRGLRRRRS